MDISLIFEIAIRLTRDIVTTQSLVCLNRASNSYFLENDIWLCKFKRDYNFSNYCSWWSSFDNYLIQKLGGKMHMLIIEHGIYELGESLYRDCLSTEKLIETMNYIVRNKIFSLVEINFKHETKEYIILRSIEEENFEILSFCNSLPLSKKYIRGIHDETMSYYSVIYIIVKISTLIPFFSKTEPDEDLLFFVYRADNISYLDTD